MSNIENLTSKIIRDAEVKAESIINEAKEKEAEIVNKKIDVANRMATSMIENATLESKSIVDRTISKTELEIRNEKLLAKQKVIEKVFEKAEIQLSRMNLDTFQSFVRNSILSLDIDGDEEIIMSIDDRAKLPKDFLTDLNKDLAVAGKKGNIKFSDQLRDLHGGYILSKDGIEINNSFKSMISSLRDELEYGVNKVLFNEN